ncbi:MAG: hypothetical protein ABIH70_06900 [Chloroflexota bacterium]
MVDEVNQPDNLPEVRDRGTNPGETEGQAPTGELDVRVAELEQIIVGKDDEIAGLKQSQTNLEEELTTLGHSLTEAVASYKAMVLKANPAIVAELITGDTIPAVNESLQQAQAMVGRLRQGLEAEIRRSRVPAGAPERTSPDLSNLSAREKIQYAIGGKR